MKLNEFVHFNQRCPICNNDLTLYLQMKNSVCFKAVKQKKNIYHFQPFKCISKFTSENDYIDLYDYGRDFETKFSSSQVAANAKKSQLYFFYLCNTNGFEGEDSGDYTINIYNGCYYRSTPFLEYQKTSKKNWTLKTIDPDHATLINNEEIFSFSKEDEDIDKVYMLNFSYHSNKTIFMHYTVNSDQKNDKNYSPNVFEKEIDDLIVRPNFSISNRDKLLSRFDTWVLLD